MSEIEKPCTKCQQTKRLSGFSYNRKMNRFASWCKACQNEHSKTYYRTHKDRAKAYMREYYKTNRDRVLEKAKQYYHAHREARLAYAKEYAQKRPKTGPLPDNV